MSEKYYVVSESELMALENTTIDAYVNPSTRMHRAHDNAYNACRARPFEKYLTVVEATKDFINSDGDYFAWTEDERQCMSRLRDTLAALEGDV